MSETPRQGGEPSLLVVAFQLKLVGHNRLLHALFRAESVLNTPLFAGFSGFRSKLWLTDIESGSYFGVYEWDAPGSAESYATALGALLRLVCVPDTVRFHVEPCVTPAAVLADPDVLGLQPPDPDGRWWRFRRDTPAP